MPSGVYKVSKSVIKPKKGGKEAINYSLRVPGSIADNLDITNARFGVRVTDEGILYYPVQQVEESGEKAKLPEWMKQQSKSTSSNKTMKAAEAV